MNLDILAQIVAILAPLSLAAVGGAFTVIPEIHRQVVDVRGWFSAAQFAELFALAQIAPGPNILLVSLLAWQVAGAPGALVAMLSICGPSSMLTFAVAHAAERMIRPRVRMAVQGGLAPVAIGMVLASGVILASAANTSLVGFVVTAVTVVLVLRTKLHPLLLMLAAALLAMTGWL